MAQRMAANDDYKKMLIRIPPDIYQQLVERTRVEDRSINGVLMQLVRKGLAADRETTPAASARHLIRGEVIAGE